MIEAVGDKQVAVAIDGDHARIVELTGRGSVRTEHCQRQTRRGQLLDPIVPVVGDVDGTVGVDAETVRLAAARTSSLPVTTPTTSRVRYSRSNSISRSRRLMAASSGLVMLTSAPII